MRAIIEVAMAGSEAVKLLKYILTRKGTSYIYFSTDFCDHIVAGDMAITVEYDRDRNTTVLRIVAEDFLPIKRILTPSIRSKIIDFWVDDKSCVCNCGG